MKRTILMIAAVLVASSVYAQDKAAEKPPAPPTVAAPAVDEPQGIPDDAKKVLQTLAQRDAGLADAGAVIQKERDAIAAEWNRTIARLQAAAPAGFELSPQLTYVKKTPPK